MDQIKYPSAVDLNLFSKGATTDKSFYGLPCDVIYCKKCVISNQRPNSAVEYNHTKDSKNDGSSQLRKNNQWNRHAALLKTKTNGYFSQMRSHREG